LRRRDFIIAGIGGLAGIPAARLLAQGKPTLGAIGVQLYTLRELAKADLGRTLAAVARAGYKEVEFAGYHGHPPTAVRKMLDDNGLVSPSFHISIDELGSTGEVIMDNARILGQKYVTVSWIDAKDRTVDGYKRIAARMNELGLLARGDKLLLAYHNNAFEFTPLAGGRSGYQILIDEADPANLVLQADVFWMQSAQQDPLAWFAKYPGRFHMMHLKDMGRPPRKAMLDVGSGTTKWPALIAAAKRAGVRHFFVEHDEPKDPIRSITSSYRYLRALKS
jgi:sugar phosphate isomerase/epimerase